MIDMKKFFGNVKLTPVEETILKYLIENTENSVTENIRDIAKKNYTSPSTIIRLSKKLGYSGFVELTYALKNKISSKTPTQDISKKNIFKTNYDDAVSDFIHYIKEGNILVSGEGFSEIVSKYFYMKLLVLGKKSILSTFIDFDILFDNHMDSINSILLISKSGEGTHCVNSCYHAKERNIPIISFTGNIESTLARNSDISFIIPDCEKFDNDNYYPNPFFAYCIETFEFIIGEYMKDL